MPTIGTETDLPGTYLYVMIGELPNNLFLIKVLTVLDIDLYYLPIYTPRHSLTPILGHHPPLAALVALFSTA